MYFFSWTVEGAEKEWFAYPAYIPVTPEAH